MNEQERKFLDSAKRLLDESVTDLDGATLSRLAQARNQALAGQPAAQSIFRRPLPLFGMAASMMALLVVVVLFGPFRQDPVEQHLVAELALLTAEEPLDFFEEIEFYEWLSTVDGEESDLACAHDDRPVSDSFSPGLFSIPARNGRGAGGGDA
jgi:hypothetical protein